MWAPRLIGENESNGFYAYEFNWWSDQCDVISVAWTVCNTHCSSESPLSPLTALLCETRTLKSMSCFFLAAWLSPARQCSLFMSRSRTWSDHLVKAYGIRKSYVPSWHPKHEWLNLATQRRPFPLHLSADLWLNSSRERSEGNIFHRVTSHAARSSTLQEGWRL